MKKALIAMSGGVDSSLAAKIMKDEGYECIGCTMKLYNNDVVNTEQTRTCCSVDDIEDARSVAGENGIPYYVFNYMDDFCDKVIQKFVTMYEHGQTPNPCIDCNRYMKFDKLYHRAMELGCEYVVTGHYARIEQEGDTYLLKKAVDESKDQSYVLYNMTQEQLAHTKFPLGSMQKSKVREIAGESAFVNAQKPDSQDICFVPDGDYAAFLEHYTGKQYPTGKFVDKEGNVLGEHKGIVHYTIGQRKGLGIAFGKPMYVTEIRAAENEVVLGENEDLFRRSFLVGDVNWISGHPVCEDFACEVKSRYRHKEQPAQVHVRADGKVEITYDVAQRAITPGQSAVLYDGDIVLGGGVIECCL